MIGGLSPPTPVFVRFVATGTTTVEPISSIVRNKVWIYDNQDNSEYVTPDLPLHVWSDAGWTPLRCIRRIPFSSIGGLYQLSTPTSYVEVSDHMPILTANENEYQWSKTLTVGTKIRTHSSPFTDMLTFGNRYSRHVHWFSIHDPDTLWTLGLLFVCGKFTTSPFGYTSFELAHKSTAVLQRAKMTLRRMFPACFFSLYGIGNMGHLLLARGHVVDFANQVRLLFGDDTDRMPFHLLDRLPMIQLAYFAQGLADALNYEYSYPIDTTSDFPKILICSSVRKKIPSATLALAISGIWERLGKSVEVREESGFFHLHGTTRHTHSHSRSHRYGHGHLDAHTISGIKMVDVLADSCSSLSVSSTESPQSARSQERQQRSRTQTSGTRGALSNEDYVYSMEVDASSYVAGIGNVVFPTCVHVTEIFISNDTENPPLN